jgi:hypothetical protein
MSWPDRRWYESPTAREIASAGQCYHCFKNINPARRRTRLLVLNELAEGTLFAHRRCHDRWLGVSAAIPRTVKAFLDEQESLDFLLAEDES